MSCKYYCFKDGDYHCCKCGEDVDDDWYFKFCRGWDFSDCAIYKGDRESISGSGSGTGCFLSSACVSANLGISEDLNIVLDDHMMLFEVGYYDDRNDRIVLNSLTVKANSGWYTLEALIHEIYHSYEHRLADVFEKLNREDQKLLLFQEAKQYYNEFINYVIPENDWVEYLEQKCEADAREFAEKRVEIYYTNVTDGYFAKQN